MDVRSRRLDRSGRPDLEEASPAVGVQPATTLRRGIEKLAISGPVVAAAAALLVELVLDDGEPTGGEAARDLPEIDAVGFDHAGYSSCVRPSRLRPATFLLTRCITHVPAGGWPSWG